VTTVDALQTALAAEHAAVHVYGALGAATSVSATPELFAEVDAAYTAHRDLRDRLTAALVEAGATPVAAEPAYDVPTRLGNPALVRRAAARLEDACAETWAWVVANTVDAERRRAVETLTRTAVRALTFRGSPEIFPGAGELADR
jgi:hypothetical protein